MGDSSIEMKRQKRHVAGRDATGKLVRHNGQDFQTFSGAICGGELVLSYHRCVAL